MGGADELANDIYPAYAVSVLIRLAVVEPEAALVCAQTCLRKAVISILEER